jgi:hypothetical protein
MMTEPRANAAERNRRSRTLLLVAVAAQFGFAAAVASAGPGDGVDEIGIQGRWAYSRQAGPDAVIDVATTPAVQDSDVWFLLACTVEGRLSAALIHTGRFSFDLDEASSVELQSERLLRTSVAVERSQPAQILMDRNLVRHILPLLIEETELSVSITERDGVVHRYTFALQPNDVALAPLRSRCSGS